jgi:hypothetical protein
MSTFARRLSQLSDLSWRYLFLAGAFVAGLALRLYILPIFRVPLDSDEAIFLLMARHILNGDRPLFFYGEAYGGSFDAYLIALFFRLFGETVALGRLVQSLEYLIGMAFTYLLARRLMPGARLGPLAVLWLMAIPPLLMSTWTTPVLVYALSICLSSILLYLGHRLLWEDADCPWRWAIFGAVAGLSFWTFGILVVTLLPLFLFFLWRVRWRRWPGYLVGTVAFFMFSAPWWTQAQAGLQVVASQDPLVGTFPFVTRVFAFIGLTIPAFFGFRDPWSPHISWLILAPAIITFYLMAILYAIPRIRRADPTAPRVEPVGFGLLGAQALTWVVLYFATRFSVDATGRYTIILYTSLFIVSGLLLERISLWRQPAAIGLLAALLVFSLGTHIRAANTVPPGITAQMNPALNFGNASDPALIDFLAAHGRRGYSHHWISYKIAYLSGGQIILAAHLPFRPDLSWNPRDDRYAPYAATVAASLDPVYVTHREPHLEAFLQRGFAERGITYRIQDIGPYRVYYDLSVAVSPQELGLGQH